MFKGVMHNIFDSVIKKSLDNIHLIVDVITRKNTNTLTDVFNNKDEIIENIILFQNETGQIEELHKKANDVVNWINIIFLIFNLGVGALLVKFSLSPLLSILYIGVFGFSALTWFLFNRISNYVKIVRKEVKRMSYEF